MLRLLLSGLTLGAGLHLGAVEGPTPEGERPDRPVDLSQQAAETAYLPLLPQGQVSVSVAADARQTFHGLGASTKEGWARTWASLPRERQERLSDLLWRDTGLTSLKLWFELRDYAPAPGVRRLDEVCSPAMVQLIRDAQARGVEFLVLAPCGVPDYLRDDHLMEGHTGETTRWRVLAEDQRQAHAEVIADFIAELDQRHGLRFSVTGIQNEPNTNHDCYFTAEGMVGSVKLLRSALDARGLQDVGIVAPETASADQIAHDLVDALRADQEAWAALQGIATHSYNMAATERLAQIALESGKEYWQTESSVPGREIAGDIYRAATMATTVLSDLNHGVTHWIHFVGFDQFDPRDNGTRILGFAPDPAAEDWYLVFEKQRYLAELARTFRPGVVLRKASSDLEAGMHWTYGTKPRVVVAAGRHPDGSWALGVSNYTYNGFPKENDFQRTNAGQPAQRFRVRIVLDELAEVAETRFAVRRNDRHGSREDVPVVARGGVLELEIDPLELVTLSSAAVGSSAE